jgi:hypothetical protein
VTDEPIQHGHRRMSTFCSWSPVTIPPTTMVTASKGPRVRAEPLVRGLRGHAEGLADLRPRRAAFVRLDDERGEDTPNLVDRVIELLRK